MLPTLSLLALMLAAPAAAPEAATPPAADAPTVAVAYFDDHTGTTEFAPLRKGLADMLITDLTGLSGIRIVERARLNAVIDELKLGATGFIDPKTAQKVGRGLAARYILTGAYALVGPTMRIDARLVEVESGAVTTSRKVEGSKEQFFAMEKELVDLLVGALGLQLGFEDKARLRSVPTESFAAWAHYSTGLEAQDRGDADAAKKAFGEALAADPGYQAAKSALARVEAIFALHDRQRADKAAALFEGLDPKAADFGCQVNQLLLTLQMTDADQLRQRIELLTWLVEQDLTPSCNNFPRVPLDILGVLSMFLQDPDVYPRLPGVCEYVMTRYAGTISLDGQCKAYIETMKAMQKVPVDRLRASWQESLATARFGSSLALVPNVQGAYRLFDACARKVAR